jgi:3D (Asp-Asp-Asp) domain-containing protein
MENLNLIRKQSTVTAMLALSLFGMLSQSASAAIGTKPSEHTRSGHRHEKATKAPRERSERPRFFANLFKGKHRPQAQRSRTESPGLRTLNVCQVRTTAYTHDEADHLVYGRSTAIGTTLRCSQTYNSAAADWSRFPLGTKFQIVGEPTVYVIDDCGGALYGTNTIDIYRPSFSAMNAWGTRFVQIKILDRVRQGESSRKS